MEAGLVPRSNTCDDRSEKVQVEMRKLQSENWRLRELLYTNGYTEQSIQMALSADDIFEARGDNNITLSETGTPAGVDTNLAMDPQWKASQSLPEIDVVS